MYEFLLKRGQLVAFGLGLILIALFLMNALGGQDQFNMLGPDEKANTTIFDLGLYAAMVLVVLCLAAAVLFGLFQVISNPKGAIKMIAGLVVVGVLFAILYSTATPETTGKLADLATKFNISENVSKLISAGISTTLIVTGIAAAAFVLGEVSNFFK